MARVGRKNIYLATSMLDMFIFSHAIGNNEKIRTVSY